MAIEEHGLKAVVDIFGGVVLVGDDFVQDHAALGLDFGLRESGLRGKFEKKPHGLWKVLLEDGGVKHYLLLGGEGVEFSAKAVKIRTDYPGAFAGSAPEDVVLYEMGYAGGIFGLIPGACAN